VLQARTLSPTIPEEANLLKRIDEYNYCKAHKGLDVTALLFSKRVVLHHCRKARKYNGP